MKFIKAANVNIDTIAYAVFLIVKWISAHDLETAQGILNEAANMGEVLAAFGGVEKR